MRLLILTLAIAAVAGCDADRAQAEDTSTATPPATSMPAPPADNQQTPTTGETTPAPPTDDTLPADSTTVPARFQGRYAADAAACGSIDHESELSIGPNSIQFHESSGAIKSVASGPNEITVVAGLTGEGETRDATYRYRLSDDGNTLTDTSGGITRQRCG